MLMKLTTGIFLCKFVTCWGNSLWTYLVQRWSVRGETFNGHVCIEPPEQYIFCDCFRQYDFTILKWVPNILILGLSNSCNGSKILTKETWQWWDQYWLKLQTKRQEPSFLWPKIELNKTSKVKIIGNCSAE